MLLPLSGANAALGRSMARAAALAQGVDKKALLILDTGGTPEGAVAAARAALKQGAGILFGPLLSAEVRPVLAACAGRVPVVTFSNDLGLLESGAFLFGITADQAVAPLLHYARTRGVRRFGLLAGSDLWGTQLTAAARRAAAAEGLEVTNGAPPRGADALLVGTMADAVAQGAAARQAGVQLLCAFSGLNGAQDALGAIEGAWLSAPDPTPFADFAGRFEAQVGTPPGVIAGLAYDAGGIAVALRQRGGEDRSALLVPGGFQGVCGAVRFRDDGSAQRTMAILAVEQGRFRLIESGSGA